MSLSDKERIQNMEKNENLFGDSTELNKDVSEAAEERISEHRHSLDLALHEFENEYSDEPVIQKQKPKKKTASPLDELGDPFADIKRKSSAVPEDAMEEEEAVHSSAAPKKRPAPVQSRPPRQRTAPNGKRPPARRKKKRERILNTSIITGLTITIVIVSLSIVLSTGAITLGMEYLGINKPDKEITFNIPAGSNNEQIADILIENGIIKNRYLFKLALKIKHGPTLYPGDISLSPSRSYPDIVEELSYMRESYKTVELTFKEGTNLLAVAKKLEKNGVCSKDDFLAAFNAKQDFELDKRVNRNVLAFYSMEGFFFPDTYEFYVDDSAYNVTKIIRENFESKITDDMYERMKEMNMDLYEVITLASIVQAEAGSAEDMPLVASIFLNRLNDSATFPSLQSDATGNYIDKVIKKVETTDQMIEYYTNNYNTYICQGLPAGPIGNPGLDAIKAVLYAEKTDYYYFCNDLKTGELFVAKTLEEHEENLKKAGLA